MFFLYRRCLLLQGVRLKGGNIWLEIRQLWSKLVLLFQLRGVSRKIWRFWRIWFPQRDDVLALKASKRWRLVSSPTEANELLSLELPRAWEPMSKKRAWGFDSSTRSPNCFLSETWADKEQLESLKVKIKYAGLFYVQTQNRRGGLALF